MDVIFHYLRFFRNKNENEYIFLLRHKKSIDLNREFVHNTE